MKAYRLLVVLYFGLVIPCFADKIKPEGKSEREPAAAVNCEKNVFKNSRTLAAQVKARKGAVATGLNSR